MGSTASEHRRCQHCRQDIAGRWRRQVSTPYRWSALHEHNQWLQILRKFYKPDDPKDGDIKPTRRGRLDEWATLCQLVESIHATFPSLASALPCYLGDDHNNQMGYFAFYVLDLFQVSMDSILYRTELFNLYDCETSPQSNLRRARRSCTTIQESPHWLQWYTPNSPPKLPLPLRRSPPQLIHPSFDQPHSPFQTASGSTQQFWYRTLSDRHTDAYTQTDRQMG